MKVLLVGEGPSELGDAHAGPGALESLVRRLLDGNDLQCESRKISDRAVHAHLRPGRGHGLTQRARAWMRFAENHGYQAIVFLVDEDGYKDRHGAIEAAQGDARLRIRRAMGLAIRSFDAWMLADETALREALGRTVLRQKDPETLEHPKSICQALLDAAGSELGLSAMYALVAIACRHNVLERRCPRGFRPFADRVRSLANSG